MPKTTLVVEMDQQQLAVRLLEAGCQISRPAGASAADALDNIDGDVREMALRMALAAMQYLTECVNAQSRVQ